MAASAKSGILEAAERLADILQGTDKISQESSDQTDPGRQIYGNAGRLKVYPDNESEVSQVLKFANDHSLTVIPEGGGTKRGLGGILGEADIVLSLARMKGIVEHSAGDLVLTVRPGTTLAEIQKQIAPVGQFLAIDAPLSETSTIGGIIAANTSGPKRLRYGSARDLVIGMRVAYPDGQVLRSGSKVVKNVAGYDMNKLYVGSMGTLGVITEINFKLKPIPQCEGLMLLEGSAGEIADFSQRIMDSMMEPVALEMLNPALNAYLGGSSCFALAVGFEDVEKAVAAQEQWVRANAGGLKEAASLRDSDASAWWRRLADLEGSADGEAIRFSFKAGSLLTDTAPLVEFVEREAQARGIKLYAHGGTGTGISHFHLQEADEGKAFGLLEAMRRKLSEAAGYVAVEKAPLAARQKIDVWGGTNPAVRRLMEGIKEHADPKKILNPGRFAGGI
ncbi:FAD-binding oxidoreductase [Ferviditalea candida]|uniref:FAD-binding oxidoreductase n=1 Tax=Ferviditalea candida TaxID=3108399 RepID=A0ABU5ZI44_9BACL|nr:FAD-binding oxidoreductase [Paenibacillaceae bacterium T2]